MQSSQLAADTLAKLKQEYDIHKDSIWDDGREIYREGSDSERRDEYIERLVYAEKLETLSTRIFRFETQAESDIHEEIKDAAKQLREILLEYLEYITEPYSNVQSPEEAKGMAGPTQLWGPRLPGPKLEDLLEEKRKEWHDRELAVISGEMGLTPKEHPPGGVGARFIERTDGSNEKK